MKTVSKIVVILLLLVIPAGVFADTISEGFWLQTSSTAGDCAGCGIAIVMKTPHTLEIVGNNGWMGYAYYDMAKDEYKGFLELTKDPDPSINDWSGEVIHFVLTYEGKTITIETISGKIDFIATYRYRGMQE